MKSRPVSLVPYGVIGAVLLGMLLLWPGLLWNFFAIQGYDPHGQCFLWEPRLVTLFVSADSLIGLSYVTISVTLCYFAYKVRRDIPFNWVFLAFGGFIIACGGTHFMDVLTVWIPVYWSSGYVRLVTALASVSTAIALPPTLPRVFALIGKAKLAEQQQQQLTATNQRLQQEVVERQRIEQALRDSHEELERRVQERTAELGKANGTLRSEAEGRRQIYESLKQSETRFRTLIETMPGAVVVANEKGAIVLTNRSAEALFNYTREEMAQLQIESLVPERYSQAHTALRQEYNAQPSARPMGVGRDLAGRRKDGTEFPVEIGLSYVQAADDGLLVLAFITNIFERKQTESGLKRYAQRMEILHEIDSAIIQGTSVEILVAAVLSHLRQLIPCQRANVAVVDQTTGEGVVFAVDVDQPTAIDIGYRQAAPPGFLDNLKVDQVRVYDDFRLLVDTPPQAKLLIEEGLVSALQTTLVAQDKIIGSLALVANTPGFFTDEHKEIIVQVGSQLAIAINQLYLAEKLSSVNTRLEAEIVERKRAEEEVRALNIDLERRVIERTTQLEAANRELEAFSYSISHDLRAPLRAIDGFSRILLRDHGQQLSSEGQRLLDVVRTNAQQMGKLIDDLLSFSRLSRQPLNKRPIAMNDLIRQVLEGMSIDLENRHVEMDIADLPTCQADPALLKQVLVNLLSNALKFTRRRDIAHLEIGSQLIDRRQIYFVKDNGAGFDMDFYDKLFGVFQRLHSNDEFEGTGVGLATVQRIIHRHGGRIWAEGAVDEGATFYFTLDGESNLNEPG